MAARRLAVAAAWWVAFFWLWLLLAGEWNRTEWIAASCAATLAAGVLETSHRVSRLRIRIPLGEVASAWTVPAVVVLDFFVVVGELVRSAARGRRAGGTFVVRPFRRTRGLAPARFGTRAWRSYAATVSPNAYVVHIDEDERKVLLHDLVPLRKSEEPAA